MTHNVLVLHRHSHNSNGGRSMRLGTVVRNPDGQYSLFCGYLDGKRVAIKAEDLEELLKNNNQQYTVKVQLLNHEDLNNTKLKRFLKWIIPNKVKRIIKDS